jgi:cytoskeleton protein RodZ
MLKSVREHAGLSVGQVAKTLNVSADVLEALENDRYEFFAAPVFARGHLKKYAAYLSIPEVDVLKAYDQQSVELVQPSLIPSMKLPKPDRLTPLIKPGLTIAAIVILLAGVIFFLMHGPIQWLDNEIDHAQGKDSAVKSAPAVMVAPEPVHSDVRPDSQATEVAVAVAPPLVKGEKSP